MVDAHLIGLVSSERHFGVRGQIEGAKLLPHKHDKFTVDGRRLGHGWCR
jgi:hypothetical protein